MRILSLILCGLLLACSKAPAPTAANPAGTNPPGGQSQANPAAVSNSNPYSEHVRAHEQAKGMGDQLDQQAKERMQQAEEESR